MSAADRDARRQEVLRKIEAMPLAAREEAGPAGGRVGLACKIAG